MANRVQISYAGTSIQTANIVVQEIEHESINHKELDIQRLSVRDGGKLLNPSFAPRRIRIKGFLKYDTQALLEDGIDDFKELLNKTTRHLDIGYISGTRRYTCDMAQITVLRYHYNLTWCDFEAEFVCVKTPFGTALDTTTVEYTTITSLSTYAGSFVATGNYNPLPKIIITFTEVAGVDGVRVRNTTTGDQITVRTSNEFANNDVIEIDCDQKTVTLNDVAWDYVGIFPSFTYGGNDLRISVEDGIHYKLVCKIVYYPLFL